MTQMELARKGKVSEAMKVVAATEVVDVQTVRRLVAEGRIAIPLNKNRRSARIVGVGQGLRVKVNANLGTSTDYADVGIELEKLKVAEEAGADAVMDLSTGGDLRAIRGRIMEAANVCVGSVPIYEAAAGAARARGGLDKMTAADMIRAVRRHAEDGVDFVTVHCGVTRRIAESGALGRRVCGIVSRGGTFLAHWMRRNRQENPFFERFDELIDIAREFDVTLSLGDGLRPGAIADAMDGPQLEELLVLAELAKRAVAAGAQVIIEGPGHVPLDQVATQVRLQKELTGGLPFYVLGPIVTDVAPGYDHITSAIGGAVAGMAGADFLCYVTSTEHLGLPRPQEVREGVIAARIAAHAADVARGRADARAWDRRVSVARSKRDWDGQINGAIDPERARRLREERRPGNDEVCSMCGDYCVFKVRDDDNEDVGVSHAKSKPGRHRRGNAAGARAGGLRRKRR
jgi:phosphomethylpyrimidine synthase